MEDLIATIIVLGFLALALMYVRSRINSIVDEQPDLGLAQAQNAPIFMSDLDKAKEFAEQYERRESGQAI